ncbi:MAG: hypothetical protein ACRESR_09080 [Gammaproteobacteria bacterium]
MRTIRHTNHTVSLRNRKRGKEIFGWSKTARGWRVSRTYQGEPARKAASRSRPDYPRLVASTVSTGGNETTTSATQISKEA